MCGPKYAYKHSIITLTNKAKRIIIIIGPGILSLLSSNLCYGITTF